MVIFLPPNSQEMFLYDVTKDLAWKVVSKTSFLQVLLSLKGSSKSSLENEILRSCFISKHDVTFFQTTTKVDKTSLETIGHTNENIDADAIYNKKKATSHFPNLISRTLLKTVTL